MINSMDGMIQQTGEVDFGQSYHTRQSAKMIHFCPNTSSYYTVCVCLQVNGARAQNYYILLLSVDPKYTR